MLWKRKPILGRIHLHVKAFPPDRRKRDIDNLLKILIDCLQDCGLFEDDSQIDKITIERMSVIHDGQLLVWIREI